MSKKRAHKTLSLEEKLTILDELSSKTHRQLAEIRHLYIANTHYNDIHYYYNDIHYFDNPNISLIRPPSGPKLFGLVRVYCTGTGHFYAVVGILFIISSNKTPNMLSCFCWSKS